MIISLILMGSSLEKDTFWVAQAEDEKYQKFSSAIVEEFPSSSATNIDFSSGEAKLLTQVKSTMLNSPMHRPAPNKPLFKPEEQIKRQPTSLSPGVSIVTPSAYGLAQKDLGIGLGLQGRTRFTNSSDGQLGIGIGFGNPSENVGLQVGISVIDLLGDSFEDGSFSLKLHRQLPANFRIAVGWQEAVTWGKLDVDSAVFGVVTKSFALKANPSDIFSQIDISIGVGGGPFRSETDVENGDDSLGVFGSIAVRVAEPVSTIVEWTGQDLTVGISWIPFSNLPLVIVPAVTDLTGTAGDGTRFIFGIGYGLSY